MIDVTSLLRFFLLIEILIFSIGVMTEKQKENKNVFFSMVVVLLIFLIVSIKIL